MSSSETDSQVNAARETKSFIYKFHEPLHQDNSIMWLVAAILTGFALTWGLQVFAHVTKSEWMQSTADFFWYGGLMSDGFWHGEFWRPLTSGFLHAGIAHVTFNLLNVGFGAWLCQKVFARKGWLIIFLASQVLGAIAAVAVSPHSAGIGASIGMMGLYGALIAGLIRHRKLARSDLPATRLLPLKTLIIMLVLQFVLEHLLPNVGHSAHAFGLSFGVLIGFLLPINLGVKILASREDLIKVTSAVMTANLSAESGRKYVVESITYTESDAQPGDWLAVVQEEEGWLTASMVLDLIGESPDMDQINDGSNTLIANRYSVPSYITEEIKKELDEKAMESEKVVKTPLWQRFARYAVIFACMRFLYPIMAPSMLLTDVSSLDWLHFLPAPLDGFAIFLGCRLGALIGVYFLADLVGTIISQGVISSIKGYGKKGADSNSAFV